MMGRAADPKPLDIAVTGMACRFPGADNLEAFWCNIVEASDCISRFGHDDLVNQGVPLSMLADPMYVAAKGVLKGSEFFDSEFFGISAHDAAHMDPQQRVFLECAWHVLEDAGLDPTRYQGTIGVYVGARMNTYGLRLLKESGETIDPESLEFIVQQDKDFVASRVSFHLDLHGPSLAVQSACSSSLSAIIIAAQSIASGQCDAAIAGGVRVSVPLCGGYMRQARGVLSSDGRCRPFDAEANGTVFSDGVGAVVLRPLHEALRDGDRIYAVIRGACINNDGGAKMSFTAPSVRGQSAAIRRAMHQARVEPTAIEMLECHGTGTLLGDTLELEGLIKAFDDTSASQPWCQISSVKANIGHTSAASGVAGFIKSALAIYHGFKPPHANFERPSSFVDLQGTPFMVASKGSDWSRNDRFAAVSSFGFGGTNAHTILASSPSSLGSEMLDQGYCVALISAQSKRALERLLEEALELITHKGASDRQRIAMFTQTRRTALQLRRAIVIDPAANQDRCVVEILSGETSARTAILVIDSRRVSGRAKSFWFDESAAFREASEAACGERVESWFNLEAKLASCPGAADTIYTVAFVRALDALGVRPALLAVPGNARTASNVLKGEVSLAEALANHAEAPDADDDLLLHCPAENGDGRIDRWLPASWDKRCRSVDCAGAVNSSTSANDTVQNAFARLRAFFWCEGIEVDWGRRSQVVNPFPKYPFARERHWALSTGWSGSQR